METIVVTTDQFVSSRSTIRFANKLARARKAKLVVLHIYHVLKPVIWSENSYKVYKQSLLAQTRKEMSAKIGKIIRSMKLSDNSFQLVMADHVEVAEGILEYTAEHPCDYICIGFSDAGTIKKIFGTHSSKLIAHSKIPVICVPAGYRSRPYKRVLYASDMTDYEVELSKLIAFVRPLHAELRMIHMTANKKIVSDKVLAEASLEKKLNYKIEIINRQWNGSHPILQGISLEIKRYKPSLIAFFTHQSRSFLDKLILPSNADAYSFYTKIPIISFKKGS